MELNHRNPFAVAALSLAVGSLVIGAAAGVAPAAAQAPESVSSPPTAGERFEGYLWLDVDGHPLPFQSDEEIEEFLRTAKVESIGKIPVGVTGPKKVVLAGNGVRVHATFKDIERREKDKNIRIQDRHLKYRDWRDSHMYDVAAYHVDRLLGLNRVPPAALRKIKRKNGSLKIWVEGSVNEKERQDRGCDPPDAFRWNQQHQILRIFDNLVANQDSNLGNTLIDGNWRLWFIDCGRCFGEIKELFYPQAITHCERGLWQALQELDEERLEERLEPYLAAQERKALLARRDKLVQHLQDRIDEVGEARVLYDLRPADERAPWAAD
jgi:hypothetical protein